MTALRASLAVAAALVLGACADSGGDAGPDAPAPLAGQDCLVIVLDALAADHLGSYGSKYDTSPNIDALAERGVRFDQAWSQTSWTLASTASLMTGLFQESHGVVEKDHRLGSGPLTLAEAFVEAGYATYGFAQNPFASTAFGFGRGFERFDDLYYEEAHRPDAVVTDGVLDALSGDGDSRPRFVYAHYRRPHAPYDPPAETAALFTEPGYGGHVTGSADDLANHNNGSRPMGMSDRRHLRGLYDAGIHTVDAELGRLFDGIDLERTLVVILSDHGEAFGRHGAYGHNTQSFEPMVNVPLVLSHPDLASGRRVDQPVMSIDLFPTLAELFGLDVAGEPLQGDSFVSRLMPGRDAPIDDDPRRPVFTSSRDFGPKRQMQAVLVDDLKFLRTSRKAFLFDLANDPREQQDLAANRPSDVTELTGLLDAWQADQLRIASEAATIDAQIFDELQKLGYMGGKPAPTQATPDPVPDEPGDDDGR